MNYIKKIFDLLAVVLFSWIALTILMFFLSFIPFPSIGTMEAVKNANPKYQFKDIHFQNLVEKYDNYNNAYLENEHDLWNLFFYERKCEVFAPNWKKVDNCMYQSKLCEIHLPLGKYNEKGNHSDEFNSGKAMDIFLEAKDYPNKYPEYSQCMKHPDIQWTIREYGIIGFQILYVVPKFIAVLPIGYFFGTDTITFLFS